MPPEPRERSARAAAEGLRPRAGDAAPALPSIPRAAALAAVVALGIAAYANSFAVPFQFDDGNLIVGNPAVADLRAFFASARLSPRVVGAFTFALNGSLGGRAVFGYHALNLAIHLAAALAVYALATLACRRAATPGAALERGAPLAALVAAALFVAHPVQTQAVTYVVQRLASLTALLYLAAVLAYARAALAERAASRRLAYGGALALAALALFTKENAVTLPASLALVDVLFLPGSARARALRLAPFVALALGSLVPLAPAASVADAASGFATAVPPATPRESPLPAWAAYAVTQPAAVLFYLRLLVLPAGQSIDHDPPIPASVLEPGVLLPAAALALLLGGAAALAWRARRRSGAARVVLLALGWFVVTMSVESSVVPLADLRVEHRMYLPSAGIFVAVGAALVSGLGRLSAGGRRITLGAAAAAVLLLAGATWARNEVWRDPLTLWSDAMAKAPVRSRPHVFVAQALMARGEAARAIPLLERATGLRPRTPLAHLNLAKAYAEVDRLGDAERAARAGIGSTSSAVTGANVLLGRILLRMGRVEEACRAFEAELAADPRGREARTNLVVCSLAAGDARGALARAERLDAEGPGDGRLLFNLALAADAAGEPARAADAYARFLAVAGPDLAPQRDAAARWLAARGGAPAR
jgi:tetratricopeptide (TPR) repeat protein